MKKGYTSREEHLPAQLAISSNAILEYQDSLNIPQKSVESILNDLNVTTLLQ